MVLGSDCDLTFDRWLSLGEYADHAIDTVYALGIHAIAQQLRVKWLVGKSLFQQLIQQLFEWG